MNFSLTNNQQDLISKWLENPGDYCGAIGGRLTFSFTPTSIGVITIVTDNLTKETLNITNYEEW